MTEPLADLDFAGDPAGSIFDLCLSVGFTPDQAVTMTAIALAESGGRLAAHNAVGENSRGLWQINWDAHADAAWAKGLTEADLHDPRINAIAAFHVSGGGADIRPWTVTHTDKRDRYPHYADEEHRSAALAAAHERGYVTAQGNFEGPANYRDDPVTAGPGGGTPPDVADLAGGLPTRGEAPAAAADAPADVFLNAAMEQAGDQYVFGAEAALDDLDPDAFDCSELVQWAAHQAGVEVPDGSVNQYLFGKAKGWVVPVEEAADTRGALLFRFAVDPAPGVSVPGISHVAISLGDGTTIEARGRAYGVGEFDVGDRFTHAIVIPELANGAPDEVLLDSMWRIDTDADRLSDAEELQFGGDAGRADTDLDGVSDFDEAARGLNLSSGDTDLDGRSDVREVFEGTDAARADLIDAGQLAYESTNATGVDADLDLLDDGLEVAEYGTDPNAADTDHDGYRDVTEIHLGWDPTAAE